MIVRRLYLLGGLLLLAVGACPSLLIGFPLVDTGGHDQDIALRWLNGFSHGFAAGVPWPRWLIDDQFGFGSPAFFFYPPLAYVGGSILSVVLGLNTDMAIRLGMAGFATIGFVLMWRLALLLGSGRRSPFLAGLYVATPWLAFIDQVDRGAFAEYASIAVLPLVGMVLLVPPARLGLRIVATGAAYALLILTHLPVAVLAAAAGLLCMLLTKDRDRIGCFLAGMLLAGALAAPLLVPAMTMQGEISAGFWQLGGEKADSQLLFGGHNYGRAMTALKYACFAVFMLVSLAMRPWRQVGRNLPLAMLVLCLLGTTILSWPAWRYLPLLPLVQFPVRLFAIIPLFWVAALAVQDDVPLAWRRQAVNLLPAAVTVFLTLGTLVAQSVDRSFAIRVTTSSQRVPEALRQPLLQAPEYLPVGADATGHTKIVSGIVLLDRSGWPGDLPKVVGGNGSVTERHAANGFTLYVDCPAPCQVLAHQFWFPGWQADDGTLKRDPGTGMIVIDVPAGGHRTVSVMRVLSPQERTGFAMSLAGLVVCMGLIAVSLRRTGRSRFGLAGARPARTM